MTERIKALHAAIISAASELTVQGELLRGESPRLFDLMDLSGFQYDEEGERWAGPNGVTIEAAVDAWVKANPQYREGGTTAGTRRGADIVLTRDEASNNRTFTAAQERAEQLGGRVVVEDEPPAEPEGPVVELTRDEARDNRRYEAALEKVDGDPSRVVVK